MFNVGGGEILVIALIALIVLGPQRLPDAARQVGKVMGELRRVSSGFQNEVRGALEEAERAATVTPARDVLAEPTATPSPAPRRARRAPLKAAPVDKPVRPRSKGA